MSSILNEEARRSSERLAITPARYDEGTIATNHKATTWERGYHHIITIAHFPEILLVFTKQAVTKTHSRGQKTYVRNSAHGSDILVRKGNGTNELWYTILRHSQPNNTRNISLVLYVHSRKRKRKTPEKHEERTGRRKKGKKKNEADLHSGRRPSPENKVAVCWDNQSYGMLS